MGGVEGREKSCAVSVIKPQYLFLMSQVKKKKKRNTFSEEHVFFFKLVICSLQSEGDDSFILLIFLSRAIIVH